MTDALLAAVNAEPDSDDPRIASTGPRDPTSSSAFEIDFVVLPERPRHGCIGARTIRARSDA